jgi:hypothetical protein
MMMQDVGAGEAARYLKCADACMDLADQFPDRRAKLLHLAEAFLLLAEFARGEPAEPEATGVLH